MHRANWAMARTRLTSSARSWCSTVRLRNADVYWRSAQRGLHAVPTQSSHTLLLVPQFLAERDVVATSVARHAALEPRGWEGGATAVGPAPVSSFEAIDAMLAMLADRRRFPKLTQVVLAGHSGGGQLVQRYAVVGQGEAQLGLGHQGPVCGGQSVVLPVLHGRPAPGRRDFRAASSRRMPWLRPMEVRVGWSPRDAQRLTAVEYENRYVKRDVVYLLGGADTDPRHPALDKSCAGQVQVPIDWRAVIATWTTCGFATRI